MTLAPQLGPVSRFDLTLGQLPVLRHGLEAPGFARAHANKVALSEEYRGKYLAGDPRAVGQLLGYCSGFELDDWLEEARNADPAVQRSLGPRAGRPAGSRQAMDQGIAVVSYVNVLMKSTGASQNAVCKRLGDDGHLGITYERIRQICREWGPEARGERRSSMFFADPRIPELGYDW
jgi:hypothetical protein